MGNQWPLGQLSWTSNLMDSQQLETTDLCGYYRPNYFAILVLVMGLFSNACNRSQKLVSDYYYYRHHHHFYYHYYHYCYY